MTDPDPMFELFRAEALTHTAAIDAALAALAADPSRVPSCEALEGAAAQILGAARIVGVGAAATLARAAEELFAAARRGTRSLDPAALAALAEVTRAIRALAESGEGAVTPAEAEALAARLGAPPAAPPPAAAPSVVAPLPTQGASLLEMFREEVKTLCGVLSEGLIQLEQDATDPRRIEPLMRAAHSIKGAARIVGVDAGVDLAHALEELLVAAQRGQVVVVPADIDLLLHAVDLLTQLAAADLAAWGAANKPAVKAAVAALEARLSGAPAPALAPLAPPPAAAAVAPVAAAVVEAPEAAPVAVAVPEPEVVDRVVRISALSLTRLLSLAGESLVEARWLQPFARSLQRLKKFQDHLADALDDLHRELAPAGRDAPPNDRAAGASDDARRRLGECRRLLGERIDEFERHAGRSDDLNSRLYREVIASRMRPFGDGTHGLARMVRDVARQLGKKVHFEVSGHDTDVDRDILDKLEAPLGHMLRNALDHGLESPDERRKAGKPEAGTLRVEARHQAGMLNVRVSDDGRGIDLDRLRRKVVERKLTSADLAGRLSEGELLDFVFLPGFSTADTVTDISGRGVGLDAVQAMAQAVGGLIRVHTRLGAGVTFELQLPITLSVMRAVLVTIGDEPFAWPLNRTDRLLKLDVAAIETLEGKPHFACDGRHVGLVSGRQVFECGGPPDAPDSLWVVLIGDRTHQYGLIVNGFLGEQDLVVRPLDARLGKVPNVAAAAVLDDGSPVLIVDVDDVIRSAGMLVQEGKLRRPRPQRVTVKRKRVLVVDDSAIVREAERQLLVGRGYEVDLAVDGMDGLNAVRQGGYDLVVSDIDMPRMTGLEFVRAVRADPAVQSLPVVIVSYKDRDEDRKRGLAVGANAYLTKSSFHDGRFLEAIEDLIGPPER